MKYITIASILLFLSCGYAQYPRLRINEYGHIVGYGAPKDTIPNDTIWIKDKILQKGKNEKGQVLYGLAGIQKEPTDSAKYYWKKAMILSKKGVPDSVNKYLKLLDNYKK